MGVCVCVCGFSEPVSVLRGPVGPSLQRRGGLPQGEGKSGRSAGDGTGPVQRETQRRSFLQEQSAGRNTPRLDTRGRQVLISSALGRSLWVALAVMVGARDGCRSCGMTTWHWWRPKCCWRSSCRPPGGAVTSCTHWKRTTCYYEPKSTTWKW